MTKRNPRIDAYLSPADPELARLVHEALNSYRQWSTSEDKLDAALSKVSPRAFAADTVDASSVEELASQLEAKKRFKSAISDGTNSLTAWMDDLFSRLPKDE